MSCARAMSLGRIIPSGNVLRFRSDPAGSVALRACWMSCKRVAACYARVRVHCAQVPTGRAGVPKGGAQVPIPGLDVPIRRSSVLACRTVVSGFGSSVPICHSYVPTSRSSVPMCGADVPTSRADVPAHRVAVPACRARSDVFCVRSGRLCVCSSSTVRMCRRRGYFSVWRRTIRTRLSRRVDKSQPEVLPAAQTASGACCAESIRTRDSADCRPQECAAAAMIPARGGSADLRERWHNLARGACY